MYDLVDRRFEQVLDVTARATVTQCHIGAELVWPALPLVQVCITRIGWAVQPSFFGLAQLHASEGVRRGLTVQRQLQPLTLVVTRNVQPRPFFCSRCAVSAGNKGPLSVSPRLTT